MYNIEIVDTAGQEEFSSFRDSSLATGDAFLVLFAINSASSWHELKELRRKIIDEHESKNNCTIPMVIVANKVVSFQLDIPLKYGYRCEQVAIVVDDCITDNTTNRHKKVLQ